MDDFLRTCRLPIVQVQAELQETSIPRKVWSKTKYTNKIQLVLWILRKKFKFENTSPLKTESLKQIQVAFDILTQFKFPLLISASAKETQYSHVVVIWDNKIIDYESRKTHVLTKENLSRLCGTYTRTMQIDEGYGLFPPVNIRQNLGKNSDFGIGEYRGVLCKKHFR